MGDMSKKHRRHGFPPDLTAETPLSKRARVFVDEYLVDLNGTRAAIRAGYSVRTAKVKASTLLTSDVSVH